MIKRKTAGIVTVLCLCLQLMVIGARAVSTADAVEPIKPDNKCALTVSCCCGEEAFSDVEVELYRVAEVSQDYSFTLTETFAASGLSINEIKSSDEWNIIRSTLEAHILLYGIEPDASVTTSTEGKACFDDLDTGIYMTVVGKGEKNDLRCRFDSALITLPSLIQDGFWQYDTTVNAKCELLPPSDSDETTELKVLKLWKGDEGGADRPKSVEVEIFRDGISYETVLLTEKEHWTYTWTAADDGSSWTVAEKNVPYGYTVTVEDRGDAFVLTNTRIPLPSDGPEDAPQTGDTSNILVYILIMTVLGTVLIVLGVARKRIKK